MRARRLIALALVALPALAQVKLYVVDGKVDRPVGSAYNFGSVEIGGTIEVLFRLRNPGPAAAKLERLDAAGAGFTLLNPPHVPVTLVAGAFVEFAVRFQPVTNGGHSAPLIINNDAVLLIGSGQPGPTVLCEGAVLAPGGMLDFGNLEGGAAASRRYSVENRTAGPIEITRIAAEGGGFRVEGAPPLPLTLAPGDSISFDVVWEPSSGGLLEGTLNVNRLSFRLAGIATEPPFPRPIITLDTTALKSGQQARIAVRFDEPSPVTGTGQLRLEFIGPDDPSFGFLAPASGRTVQFGVQKGKDLATFGGRADIEFQTGSTAGTIVITAVLGSHTEQAVVQLAPQVIHIDSARGIRAASTIELTLGGFDNTRTAGQLAFTFRDRGGQALGSGAIHADASAAFAHHFETANVGGLFFLRAVFPVTGAIAQIDSVDVEMRNSAGAVVKNVKITE
ncbi:MAG TPA: choice-of-anchor D domain-containing protein [Bryobacteraceae bacterium]|nr:choice-of-anchor D domain-containing protein [Bryobacteraceae bacterium]HPU70527.1 choice-of-anchor D domain-containing protein [Bryobacteraceae bacterium]